MAESKWEYRFVVYRFDRALWSESAMTRINDYIKIKEILMSEERAIAEVGRLASLRDDPDVEYFYQRARYYPNGDSPR